MAIFALNTSKRVITAALTGVAAFIMAQSAQAAFPERAVHLTIGYAPGGSVDIVGRLLAQKLSEKWGQPVLVENRPGADGSVGATYVANSAPDGYNLILVTSNITVPPSDYTLQYHPVNSFTQITQVAYLRNDLVVNADLPVKNLRDFINLVKSKPGQMNNGGSGTGTTNYLDMAQFFQIAGMKMEYITYKGGNEVVKALLGNEIHMNYAPIPISYELVKAGKFKVLAVSGKGREPTMPDVPNFQEDPELKNFEPSVLWFGIVGPAKLPKDVEKKIHDDLVDVLKAPDLLENFGKQGITALGNSSEEFTKQMSADLVRWANIVKSLEKR